MSPADRPVRPEGDDTPPAPGDHVVHPDGRRGVIEAVDERGIATVVTEIPASTTRILTHFGWLRAASAAPETSPATPPLFLTSFERDYVQALNAILGSRGEGADVHRWRGHAEALRQVCERIRRDLGLPAANYTTESWRARNGVYQQDYLDSIHRPAARAATPTETTEH